MRYFRNSALRNIAVCSQIVGLIAVASAHAGERPRLTYTLDGSVNTGTTVGQNIANAMAAAVAQYNRYGVFDKHVIAYYNTGVATSDGNPGASVSANGSIRFHTQYNTRVAQHELTHTLGAGYYSWGSLMVNGVWQGDFAQATLKSLDGPSAEMNGDGIHFWPYGMNYDSEYNATSAVKNVLMTAAWRMDMGIGYAWPPVNGPANGTYRLTPMHDTSKALRAIGGAGNSAALDIATYSTGALNQQFILQRQPDGTYEIKSAQAGNRNVDIPGASITAGTAVWLYDDNNGDNQRWIIEPHGTGTFRITSKNHLLRVLEADGAGTADGTLADSGDYTGTTGTHQTWRLDLVAGGTVETFAYWKGDVNGNWNTNNSGNTNWCTGYNLTTELGAIPDLLKPVFFPGGTANRNTTLGQAFNIPGLVFDGTAAPPAASWAASSTIAAWSFIARMRRHSAA